MPSLTMLQFVFVFVVFWGGRGENRSDKNSSLFLASDVDGAPGFRGEPPELCRREESGCRGCDDGVGGRRRWRCATAGYFLSVPGLQAAGQCYGSSQRWSAQRVIYFGVGQCCGSFQIDAVAEQV